MIHIDGSTGEGGGQVLRTSLALSILTGQEMRITRIRSRRSKPGLMAQHLQSVQAAASISGAEVEGARLGSSDLVFKPGPARAGRYDFEIGTAGSTSLVLQTIFLPLSLAGGSSQVAITGGTHNPHSPVFHYLDMQWMPFMRQMGCEAALTMERAGFYPPGGGKVRAVIKRGALRPVDIIDRGDLVRIRGISGVARLDMEIATRQKHQALRRLEPLHRDVKIKTIELEAASPGTFLLVMAEFERSQCCFVSLGERGKRAERVADEAVDGLEACLRSSGAVDPFLADQLLLPMALTEGTSSLSTGQVTGHLITNA
ncbi:MAG: RNA 3'-terminal phosphate cyclase, partial [Chloroflexi bacterium]